MSVWSKLGKGLAIGGAGLGTLASFGAASPALAAALGGLGLGGAMGGAVGGALGTAGNILGRSAGNIGQVAGGAASGLTGQRLAEAQLNQGVDRNALERASLGIGQNTSRDAQALQRAQFGIDAASARAKQAAYGDQLQNIQDVNIDFAPRTGALPKFNIAGGLRPSNFGPNARQAGGELSRQALLALMNKSDVPAASAAVDLPTIGGYTHAGAGEKTLQGIGLGGSLWGALQPALEGIGQSSQPKMGTPGAPILSPGDVAYGQSQSPDLLPQNPQQVNYFDPELIRRNFPGAAS
jgi:hypothetical protein